VITGYLGFSHYDASKLMGLAAYGNPKVFQRQFQSLMRVGETRIIGSIRT
jgi:carbamoyltransferase